MAYLAPVNSPETARAFLGALHVAGLLYHPEDSAYDCLAHHNLGTPALNVINANMAACFSYLPDPCEDALALIA